MGKVWASTKSTLSRKLPLWVLELSLLTISGNDIKYTLESKGVGVFIHHSTWSLVRFAPMLFSATSGPLLFQPELFLNPEKALRKTHTLATCWNALKW